MSPKRVTLILVLVVLCLTSLSIVSTFVMDSRCRLRLIEKKGILHQALKKAFSALYGYTSDADGIRHALLDESTLTKADARFMLISCSAFVNYLKELSDGGGR